MIQGFRKALETSDLWLLRKEETTDYNRGLFQRVWEEALNKWRAEQAAIAAVETASTDSESNVTSSNPQMLKADSSTDVSVASTSNTQRPISAEQLAKEHKKKKEKEEKKEEDKPKPPLVKILLKVYGLYILIAQLIMVVYVFLYYLNPCLLWCVFFLCLEKTFPLEYYSLTKFKLISFNS